MIRQNKSSLSRFMYLIDKSAILITCLSKFKSATDESAVEEGAHVKRYWLLAVQMS